MDDGLRDVLFAGLGCEATDSIRPIGDMPKDDFEAVVASLTSTAGGAPTPFMASSWRLFGRLARLAVGAEKTTEQTAWEAAAVPPPPQLAAQASHGKPGLTKLATVLDQGLDDKVPTLSDTDITAAYLKYSERMGKPPAEDCEPSIEQVTAIQHLLKSSAPPYADFSVVGPHSIRMRKRMKLGGFSLAADGSLQKCELFGLSSFADWSKPYKVLATILIILEQVWPEELDAYQCLLLITKSTSQDTVLEGDVLISGIGSSLPSQIGGGHPLSRDRSPRRYLPPPPGGKRGDERERQHNLGADGLFTTNRAGHELCQKFQRGECQQAACGSRLNRHDLVHQCAKCLSQSHGATHPTTCTAVAKPPQKGRGGGKGRGRGKY